MSKARENLLEAFAGESQANRRYLAFSKQAEKEGSGVVALDSKMIDPPVVKRALRTIERAIKAGKIYENWREEHA